MKKLLMLFVLCLLPSVSHSQALVSKEWKSFSIGISTSVDDVYADVSRDWYNGMWLMGYGKEVFPIFHRDSITKVRYEVAYIGVYNEFAGLEGGKGVFGADLGIKLPTIILHGIGWATDHDLIKDLPPWGQKLQYATSVEFGGGDRFFGLSDQMKVDGVKAMCWTVGVHVNLPVSFVMSNWWGKAGSL